MFQRVEAGRLDGLPRDVPQRAHVPAQLAAVAQGDHIRRYPVGLVVDQHPAILLQKAAIQHALQDELLFAQQGEGPFPLDRPGGQQALPQRAFIKRAQDARVHCLALRRLQDLPPGQGIQPLGHRLPQGLPMMSAQGLKRQAAQGFVRRGAAFQPRQLGRCARQRPDKPLQGQALDDGRFFLHQGLPVRQPGHGHLQRMA